MSDKYLEMLDKLKQLKEQQKEGVQGNPEETLKKIGINISKIDREGLIRGASELKDAGKNIGNIFSNEQFGNFKNLHEKLSKKENLTDEDKGKLSKVLAPLVVRQIEESSRECFFINKNECDGEIIDAHSIQKKNGKLNRIASQNKLQVYQFVNDYSTKERQIKLRY